MRIQNLITIMICALGSVTTWSSHAQNATSISVEEQRIHTHIQDRLQGFCLSISSLTSALGYDCQELAALSKNPAAYSALSPLEKEALSIPRIHRILEVLTPRVHLAPIDERQAIQEVLTALENTQPQRALLLIAQYEKRFHNEARGYGYNLHFDFLRARALSQKNDTKNAILLYQKITAQHPELPDPWNNLGVLYFTNQQIPLAIDAFTMALRIDPRFRLARQNLIEAHREQANILEQRL